MSRAEKMGYRLQEEVPPPAGLSGSLQGALVQSPREHCAFPDASPWPSAATGENSVEPRAPRGETTRPEGAGTCGMEVRRYRACITCKNREITVHGWQEGLGAAARLHPQTSHLGTDVTERFTVGKDGEKPKHP